MPPPILAGPKRMPRTLLEFAKPLLDRLPPDETVEESRATLQFAAAVWNAVILRDISGAVEHLATRMPPRLRVRPSRQMGAIRSLLARKWRLFRDDDHFIAALGVYPDMPGVERITVLGVCPDPRCCAPQASA
jgi:hypothetical protein